MPDSNYRASICPSVPSATRVIGRPAAGQARMALDTPELAVSDMPHPSAHKPPSRRAEPAHGARQHLSARALHGADHR